MKSLTLPFVLLFFCSQLTQLGCTRSSAPVPAGSIKKEIPLATLEKIKAMNEPRLEKPSQAIRFATFNVSFHRAAEGQLAQELAASGSEQAAKIAEIIQRVRPDVLLLNEFDYDSAGDGLKHFQNHYLKVAQAGLSPIDYPHSFSAPVNTGVDSGLDLDRDGVMGNPGDAYGYGAYPGQYGMVVLSQFPIDPQMVRTFQKFLWKDMPNARWPIDPTTQQSYYSDSVKAKFRLSSKSHWDLPIQVGTHTVHFLVSHPTPPVFDGPEDRNGCRNQDEIRFWVDYISNQDYVYDDLQQSGGLAPGSKFVIAGDLNADPVDGDSRESSIAGLLNHPAIDTQIQPFSRGAVLDASSKAEANQTQTGKPEFDTASFNPQTGNLRVDYCLPSGGSETEFKALQAGVYWPLPDEEGGDLVAASDHRLTWVDIRVSEAKAGLESNPAK